MGLVFFAGIAYSDFSDAMGYSSHWGDQIILFLYFLFTLIMWPLYLGLTASHAIEALYDLAYGRVVEECKDESIEEKK
jgi:hypothetical protein